MNRRDHELIAKATRQAMLDSKGLTEMHKRCAEVHAHRLAEALQADKSWFLGACGV